MQLLFCLILPGNRFRQLINKRKKKIVSVAGTNLYITLSVIFEETSLHIPVKQRFFSLCVLCYMYWRIQILWTFYRRYQWPRRPISSFVHCNKNPIYVIPEKELRSVSPNFHIHVSMAIYRFPGSVHAPHFFLGPCKSLTYTRKVEIGTKAMHTNICRQRRSLWEKKLHSTMTKIF